MRSRRLIALLAAYVVALQGLLLPLTLVAYAAPESVLCTTTGPETPQPAGHDTGCACAAGCGMQCGASTLAGPPAQALIAARTADAIVTVPLLSVRVAILSPDGTPHSPRAPPAV